MDQRFKRNLQIGYGFSFLLLVAVGALSYLTFRNLMASDHEVDKSNLVIRQLEQTISIMKDAETGQRGYLLTGKPEFLQPYNGAYQQALASLQRATQLTSGDSRQQKNMVAIRNIMLERMTILEAMIRSRQQGNLISMSELESGKAAMDALRSAADKAENEEQQLLNKRSGVLGRYATWTPIFLIGAMLLALIIAIASYINVLRDFLAKERLRGQLEEKEQQTAAFNEELTAANEEITAANEELTAINEELIEAREELASANESLEGKVAERTRELKDSEEETQALNEELTAINEELAAANEEYQATNEDLVRTRDELQKSEHLFRAIAQNIPGSVLMVIGQDHRVITLAGDLLGQMNYNAKDHEGKHLQEITSPERYAANRNLYERLLAGEAFRTGRKGQDGADYQVDFVPLFDDAGKVYAGLILVLDITAIKKAEERSAKLAAIVETSDDAIVGKQLDGIVTSWNRSAERLFGYSESEMVGQSILRIIPEGRQEEEPQIIARIRRGERVEHFETKRQSADGRLIDVSLTISPVLDPAGNIIGVSKIARDISEQKLNEQRKSDFIGMASHELKTPLTSLNAILQVVKNKVKDSPDTFLPNALERANQQVKKMTGLINGFLNVSRLESGNLAFNPEPFDLAALITEIIEELRLTVSSHSFDLLSNGQLTITADREKTGSVITNLLTNAVKYSPKRKNIRVRYKIADGEVLVSVEDEGMGIKPHDIPRLFERYYRVSTEHTRHISGFGVGLYLSAEIIRQQGGRIWVESEKGVGSVFYFTLPTAAGLSNPSVK